MGTFRKLLFTSGILFIAFACEQQTKEEKFLKNIREDAEEVADDVDDKVEKSKAEIKEENKKKRKKKLKELFN